MFLLIILKRSSTSGEVWFGTHVAKVSVLSVVPHFFQRKKTTT